MSDSGNKGKKSKAKQATAKLQDEINETVDEKLQGQKQAQITQKRRKKLKRTVHVETTDLNFEVHYALHKEPHILLAQVSLHKQDNLHFSFLSETNN